MPRNLVLFDLEWNIGYQPYTFNYHGVQQTLRGEIVEIGAVKIDEDANVLDTFSIHLENKMQDDLIFIAAEPIPDPKDEQLKKWNIHNPLYLPRP